MFRPNYRVTDKAIREIAKQKRLTWRPERCIPLVALGYVILGGLATAPIWLWLLG
ncbi:MAG: hypothetical protein QM303_04880 [Bacillota bacterium]|nr:hypothetical protein [Bacillota bacterium]